MFTPLVLYSISPKPKQVTPATLPLEQPRLALNRLKHEFCFEYLRLESLLCLLEWTIQQVHLVALAGDLGELKRITARSRPIRRAQFREALPISQHSEIKRLKLKSITDRTCMPRMHLPQSSRHHRWDYHRDTRSPLSLLHQGCRQACLPS